MTHQQVSARLAERPELYQGWESAQPIGEDGGMFYLSSIFRGEENVGTVHVYIWDKKVMGNPVAGRKAVLGLMKRENLDRLVGEVDCQNLLGINFAKRVGFNVIGVVRQRKDAHGNAHDVVLFDALPGDLAWA